MEDYLTTENKLIHVERECERLKNSNGNIDWDNCVLIIKKMFPTVSETKLTKLLSDSDTGSVEIQTDDLKEIINHLLLEDNNATSSDDELPDVEEEYEHQNDLLKELASIIKKDGSINKEVFEQLTKKHNVNIDK